MDDVKLRQIMMDMFSHAMKGQFQNRAFTLGVAEAVIKKLSDLSGLSVSELCSFAQPIDVQICTDTKGYHSSYSDETYQEIDTMIRNGYSNAVISEKTGVHRNTISKRRSMLGLKRFSR